MNSVQYEELCRLFLAEKLGLAVDAVKSATIPNPQRPELPAYQHQIDLYWETGNELAIYVHIANAKWRGAEKVDQPEVLLLQKVREKVAAHKAVMITNTGFTAGALAAAKDDGIALHIVRPVLDVAVLATTDRMRIQAQLQELSTAHGQAIYAHTIEHRAFDLGQVQVATPRASHGGTPVSDRMMRPAATKMVTGSTTRTISPTRGGHWGTTDRSCPARPTGGQHFERK